MTILAKALHCIDQFSLHPARATLCVLLGFLDISSNGKQDLHFSSFWPFIFLQPCIASCPRRAAHAAACLLPNLTFTKETPQNQANYDIYVQRWLAHLLSSAHSHLTGCHTCQAPDDFNASRLCRPPAAALSAAILAGMCRWTASAVSDAL